MTDVPGLWHTKKVIGLFEPAFYKCPVCGEVHTTYIMVYSIYFHVFWIPFFPQKKVAVANCSECGFCRDELKFGPNLVKEFAEKANGYKHPWWTYAVLLLLIAIVSIIVLSVLT